MRADANSVAVLKVGMDVFDKWSVLFVDQLPFLLQRVALLGVNSISNKASQSADIVLTIEVQDVDTLRKVMSSLNQINDVYDVARKDA